MVRFRSHSVAILFILILSAAQSQAQSTDARFPLYDSIKPNVEFWIDIYSRYTTREGVLHDNRHLDRVYGVIELENPDWPGGRKINRQRTKQAKKHYRSILARLADGQSPKSFEEKRVAALFGPNATVKDFYRAKYDIRCQVGQSDRFRAGIIRSGAYLAYIKRTFRAYGLPEDLAYLPHVESSFNPKAFSKFGAAGMWQFTRSTGKQYMSVGYTVDERRDPMISTDAAARYLKRSYQRLQDWPMAITSYNHGTAGMMRAKRARGDYETIFNHYQSRTFGFASRNFYSEFLAARHVAVNYRRYFGELKLDDPPRVREVQLDGFVSMPDLAQHLDLDVDTLHRLNPSLRKPVVEGTKLIPRGYRLRLPAEQSHLWDGLLAEKLPQLYKKEQTHSRFYTVRYGDTAGKIARKHRIRLKDLIAANHLDARATIYVNQNLRIPSPGEHVPTQVALAGKKTPPTPQPQPPQPDKATREPILIAKSSPAAPLAAQPGIGSPEPQERPVTGKSSPALAAGSAQSPAAVPQTRFETSPVANQANGPLQPLERMTVAAATIPRPETPAIQLVDSWQIKEMPAVAAAVNPEIITGNLSVERVFNQHGRPVGLIRVEVEETLGHYAEWLGVRAQDLRRLNRLRYGRMIRIGQQLKIPLHRVDQDLFEEKRYEYHKGLAEDFFSAFRVSGVQTYFIKRGDNIWTLSRESFELPLWLIQRYNTDVDLNALLPSQKLLIPVVEENA